MPQKKPVEEVLSDEEQPTKRIKPNPDVDHEDDDAEEDQDDSHANGNGKSTTEANGNKKTKEADVPKEESKPNVDDEDDEDDGEDEEWGSLIIAGGVNWDLVARKELPKAQRNVKNVSAVARNLWGPHRWVSDLKIKSVHSSTNAAHSVIVTTDGKALVFGRNDRSQLGLGDLLTRHQPTVVESLKNQRVLSAAVGKNHTLFLTENGVYGCGDNKLGQCGVGNQTATINTPTKVVYTGKRVVKMACGGEFSMILDASGALYSFGSPEYGQLGHNSEGKYFTTGNKIAFSCETTPRRVVVFVERSREGHVIPMDDVQVVDIACGTNHALAIDQKKRCFTWGFAGYGRLGHNDTRNELMPRNLKTFDYVNKGLLSVHAGSTFSLGVDENGILYFWGQTKSTGEATMYPKPVQDLAGWNIRSVACANKSIVVVADESVIAWGPSPTFGELGYGENKPHSSTIPQELKSLDGVHVHHISCGYSHTLYLARNKDEKERERIAKLPKWP
jgi:alpha-tubulin suppressor-like RCC1 family protein